MFSSVEGGSSVRRSSPLAVPEGTVGSVAPIFVATDVGMVCVERTLDPSEKPSGPQHDLRTLFFLIPARKRLARFLRDF